MAEYSRLAKGHVTSTGGAIPVVLPFVPSYVELVNYTAMTTPTTGFVTKTNWDVMMGQGAAAYELFNATPVLTTATTLVGGISSFTAGLALQFGPQQQIVAATASNPITFTVTGHGYMVGDVVLFQGLYQTPTTGMPQIAGMPFVVSAVVDANNFQVVWPATGSNYTALSGSPVGAFVKKVLFPFLYEPGVSFIESITLGTTTTVVTTSPHCYVPGQEIAFRIPSTWGTTQLNSLPNNTIPGSPIYGFVQSVTNATTFVCNINSTGFTPFNTNQTVASVPGLSFPQVVAVGDVNTGGGVYSGGLFYPSPVFPTGSGASTPTPTINGPAINGAFVNNTSQGFIIGPVVSSTPGQIIYWRAFIHDFST